MQISRTGLVAAMVAFSLCGCSRSAVPSKDESPTAEKAAPPMPAAQPERPVETAGPATDSTAAAPQAEPAPETAFPLTPFLGDFADADYVRRGEGYDWVGVTIEQMGEGQAYIRVRSRGDGKRPTCTFDGVGVATSDTVLQAEFDGTPILFTINEDVLKVSVTKEDDMFALSYFCSGGATLEGPYTRLREGLDKATVAPEAFSRVLSLQDVTFTVTANDAWPNATLVVRPSGLELDNSLVVRQVEGQVTGAEIEDLNADGWPELMVYSQSTESGNASSVVAFSVNAGKSMSGVAFPPLEGDALIGYRGGDEFSVVESSLGRRFRVFKDGDPDGAPTGPMRQLRYSLEEGESSRVFKLVDITEIPLP